MVDYISELINRPSKNILLRFKQRTRKTMLQVSSAIARTFRPIRTGLPVAVLFGLLVFALIAVSPFSAGIEADAGVVIELEPETGGDGESRDQSDGASAAVNASAANIERNQWLIALRPGESRTRKKINSGSQSQTRAPPVRI